MEEEKRRARKVIAKHEGTIKSLEKQLADEKNAKVSHEKFSNDAKKHLAEIEGKYRFEVSVEELLSFFLNSNEEKFR